MSDHLTIRAFHETEGVGDWRVIGDGACAFFPTGSFAAGARLVRAIGELPDIDDHAPDVDLRPDGVTVRLVTLNDEFMGMTTRDVDVARRISVVARDLGLIADPSAVQSVLVIPGASAVGDVMPFWRACSATIRVPTARTRTSSTLAGGARRFAGVRANGIAPAARRHPGPSPTRRRVARSPSRGTPSWRRPPRCPSRRPPSTAGRAASADHPAARGERRGDPRFGVCLGHPDRDVDRPLPSRAARPSPRTRMRTAPRGSTRSWSALLGRVS